MTKEGEGSKYGDGRPDVNQRVEGTPSVEKIQVNVTPRHEAGFSILVHLIQKIKQQNQPN